MSRNQTNYNTYCLQSLVENQSSSFEQSSFFNPSQSKRQAYNNHNDFSQSSFYSKPNRHYPKQHSHFYASGGNGNGYGNARFDQGGMNNFEFQRNYKHKISPARTSFGQNNRSARYQNYKHQDPHHPRTGHYEASHIVGPRYSKQNQNRFPNQSYGHQRPPSKNFREKSQNTRRQAFDSSTDQTTRQFFENQPPVQVNSDQLQKIESYKHKLDKIKLSYPKEPLSAEQLFENRMFNQVKQKMPHLPAHQIKSLIESKWRHGISDEERIVYKQEAEQQARDFYEQFEKLHQQENTILQEIHQISHSENNQAVKAGSGKLKFLSAFRFYRREEVQKIRQEHPDMEGKNRHKLLRLHWQALSDNEKLPFVLMSRADRERALYQNKLCQIKERFLQEQPDNRSQNFRHKMDQLFAKIDHHMEPLKDNEHSDDSDSEGDNRNASDARGSKKPHAITVHAVDFEPKDSREDADSSNQTSNVTDQNKTATTNELSNSPIHNHSDGCKPKLSGIQTHAVQNPDQVNQQLPPYSQSAEVSPEKLVQKIKFFDKAQNQETRK